MGKHIETRKEDVWKIFESIKVLPFDTIFESEGHARLPAKGLE
jgi:hypothetical protein